jgi:hypothetical protein
MSPCFVVGQAVATWGLRMSKWRKYEAYTNLRCLFCLYAPLHAAFPEYFFFGKADVRRQPITFVKVWR